MGMLVLGGAASALAPTTTFAQATAPAQRDFAIPAQSLTEALLLFGRQSGLQVTVDPSLATGKVSTGISGHMAPAEALSRLLAGSGLTFQFPSARTATIVRAPEVSDSAIQLGPVRVEGNSDVATAPDTFDGTSIVPLKPIAAHTGVLIEGVSVADTPYTVTTIPEKFLRDRGSPNVLDILRNLPGVQIRPATAEAGGISITQRGKGALITFDGFSTLPNSSFPTQMIESIESLQGPAALEQGFFGSGGGTVNLTLKRPRESDVTVIDAGITNFGGKNILVDTSQQLDSAGKLAVRVNLAAQDLRSHLRGDSGREYVAGLSLDAKPFDGTLLQAVGYYLKREATPQASIQFYDDTVAPRHIDPKLFLGYPYGKANNKTTGVNLQLIQNLPFDFKLRVEYSRQVGIFGGYHTAVSQFDPVNGDAVINVYAYGYGTGLLAGRSRRFRTEGAEAKIYGSFKTGPLKHDLAVGYHRDSFYYEFGGGNTGFFGERDPILVNLYTAKRIDLPRREELVSSPADPDYVRGYDQGKPSAFFVQDRISLGDKLSAWVGVNFGKYDYFVTNELGTAVRPDGTNASTLKKATFSYALTYKPITSVTLYGSTQESVAQGGRAPSLIDEPRIANPDEQLPFAITKQYEFGAKWDSGGAIWSAAYFHIDEPFDFYRSEPDDKIRLVRAGHVINKGVSVSVQGEVARRLQVQAGFQILSAKVTATDDPQALGKTPAGVAEKVGNATVEYALPWVPGLIATASVYYTGRFPLNTSNAVYQSGYATVDLGARYETKLAGKDVSVRALLSNVTNTFYFYDPNTISVGAPRTFTVSGSIKF